jgi:peptidoglycan/LPS O-acetylase OafA/YrhL
VTTSTTSPPTPPFAPEIVTPKTHFVRGIDTLRFWAAIWVVLYHGAAPPIGALAPASWSGRLDILARLPFNGNAAVVLFFVISGFCIHIGNVGRPRIAPARFWAQRAARIVPPLLAIIVIASLLGPAYSQSLQSVLWSVYCELVYYALYPFMFPLLKHRRSRLYLTLASVTVTFVLSLLHSQAKFLWEIGWLTWLHCYLFWLIGCYAAIYYQTSSTPIVRAAWSSAWLWRGVAITYSIFATILANFPGIRIGYVWTMPPLAMFCGPWLLIEIAAFRSNVLTKYFERLGLASYTIYLVHKVSITFCNLNNLPWIATILSTILFTAAFYFFVEKPSHLMSKWLGRIMLRREA